jgi:tetratricopeptide (TPR) repeat protein
MAFILKDIGQVYSSQNDFEQALSYLKESLKIMEEQ